MCSNVELLTLIKLRATIFYSNNAPHTLLIALILIIKTTYKSLITSISPVNDGILYYSKPVLQVLWYDPLDHHHGQVSARELLPNILPCSTGNIYTPANNMQLLISYLQATI